MKILLEVPQVIIAEIDRIVARNRQDKLYHPQPEELRKAAAIVDVVEASDYVRRIQNERAQNYPVSRPGVLRLLILSGFTALQNRKVKV